MVVWDALALIAELSFGSPLFKVSGDQIGGVLAAHGSFGGAMVVPLALYVYTFVRGPLRYRGVLWLGALEQSAAALFAVYHAAAGDVKVEGIIVPLVVSGALLVLLLVNMPRGATTS